MGWAWVSVDGVCSRGASAWANLFRKQNILRSFKPRLATKAVAAGEKITFSGSSMPFTASSTALRTASSLGLVPRVPLSVAPWARAA